MSSTRGVSYGAKAIRVARLVGVDWGGGMSSFCTADPVVYWTFLPRYQI